MTDLNVDAVQQPLEQRKRLSCVTCHAPLPIGPTGEVQKPGYFAQVSICWKPGDGEFHRAAEDFSTLCKYMGTVGETLQDVFRLMEIGTCKDLAHLNLTYSDDRQPYLKNMRSLCSLLKDLGEETERKIERLDKWIWEELKAEEKREG